MSCPASARFVSCVHLVVGLIVMSVFWATKVVPFEKPDETFLKDVTLPAFLHAFGHCLTNVSFAAVAVSFTHTIKSALPLPVATPTHSGRNNSFYEASKQSQRAYL